MLNIAIIAGGDSGEYEISMQSGRQVEAQLDKEKFQPYLIEIRKENWNYLPGENRIEVDKNDFTLQTAGKRIRFDAVFNAIHGTPGEDGKIQGYFDMVCIPYTSCDVTTSALTFNKNFCKQVVSSFGIVTANSIHLFSRNIPSSAFILQELSLPVFVKPNNGGSSVGISKVNRQKDLEQAIHKAFHEDEEILIEKFIPGRELTCGVLRTKGQVVTFPVTEIISKKEFFDYEAKYTNGLSNEVVPADISKDISDKCQSISANLYERLNCRGVVRFDYILNGDIFYFLEVNTVPGLTAQSIVPKMARAHGWTMTELCTRLIEESLIQ